VLIPLASARIQALSFALYNPASPYGKVFKWLVRASASAGLLKIAGNFLAVSVRTFETTESIQPILDDKVIAGLQRDWGTDIGKGPICCALSLGTPGFYRKVTALVFDNNETPIAFAKVGCTPQAECLINNERRVLDKLRTVGLQKASMPALLGSGKTGPSVWLLQSPLLEGRPSPNDLQKEHFAFLTELAQATVQAMPLSASAIWLFLQRLLRKAYFSIKDDFKSERPFIEKLRDQVCSLKPVDVQKPWPFSAAHGDFAPWNMRLADGRLSLFDWEYFLPQVPAGWDIVYFIFRVENLIKRLSLQQIWQAFGKGAYSDKIIFFEKKAHLEIPDHSLLAMLVILSIALDLVPEMITDIHAQ